MENAETQVQKHLVSFCKILPAHAGCWNVILQESVRPLEVLENLSEQQRHVKNANLGYFEDFGVAQSTLIYQISNRMEEELVNLKQLIDKLNKYNFDLKNKLLTLERSTLTLDWEKNTILIRGNGSRPSLPRLLQSGLAFLNFFSKNARNIGDSFKSLDVDNMKSVVSLKESFNVDLDDKTIVSLIALTQYVDHENAIL